MQTRWEPGTGAWFLMSSEYANIKAGHIRFLWLYGSCELLLSSAIFVG